MNEKWLHRIWMYRLFTSLDLVTTEGAPIEILDKGQYNNNAGPDFLFCKIKYNNLILAGHIELHLKSSDWEKHHHQYDSAYDNVVLHVVYEHDQPIQSLENKNIPTIELKNSIDLHLISKFDTLNQNFNFIPCETLINQKYFNDSLFENLIVNKLEEKCHEYDLILENNKNHHENLLFQKLAYGFGLKINADIFQQLAENIDFGILQKVKHNLVQLEALLLGKAGLLNSPTDEQSKIWQREYEYLKLKYKLQDHTISPKFLRLRPANFPTIRLSQLAYLYHSENHIFSKIINAEKTEDLFSIFQNIKTSPYWENHYIIGKESKSSTKKLSKEFIDRLMLNVVLPIIFYFKRNMSEDIFETITALYRTISAEENAIISEFHDLNIQPQNALDSQALLYLYKHFCREKKCLNCNIGYQLLKSK